MRSLRRLAPTGIETWPALRVSGRIGDRVFDRAPGHRARVWGKRHAQSWAWAHGSTADGRWVHLLSAKVPGLPRLSQHATEQGGPGFPLARSERTADGVPRRAVHRRCAGHVLPAGAVPQSGQQPGHVSTFRAGPPSRAGHRTAQRRCRARRHRRGRMIRWARTGPVRGRVHDARRRRQRGAVRVAEPRAQDRRRRRARGREPPPRVCRDRRRRRAARAQLPGALGDRASRARPARAASAATDCGRTSRACRCSR